MSEIEVILLGRKIGMASGWDALDTCCFDFYDFRGIPGFRLSDSDALTVDLETGMAESAGVQMDLLELLQGIERNA